MIKFFPMPDLAVLVRKFLNVMCTPFIVLFLVLGFPGGLSLEFSFSCCEHHCIKNSNYLSSTLRYF